MSETIFFNDTLLITYTNYKNQKKKKIIIQKKKRKKNTVTVQLQDKWTIYNVCTTYRSIIYLHQ